MVFKVDILDTENSHLRNSS